jgi:hypothetical protein
MAIALFPSRHNLEAMNRHELTERLAKQSHRSRGQAADAVDNLVYGLLKDLKQSEKKEHNSDKPYKSQEKLPKPDNASIKQSGACTKGKG